MLGTYLNFFISIRQVDSIIHFVAWIAIGLVAGLIGSRILNETRYGLGRDVLLSIFGAIVGGFFSHLFGRPGASSLDLYSLGVAAVAAVVFLIVYHALFRRRRFLSMR